MFLKYEIAYDKVSERKYTNPNRPTSTASTLFEQLTKVFALGGNVRQVFKLKKGLNQELAKKLYPQSPQEYWLSEPS